MEENAAVVVTDYKKEKKYFSSIGIRYFAISLIVMIVQIGALYLADYINEDILNQYYMLVGMLPAYIVIVPVLFLIFRNVGYEAIPVKKFSAGQLVSAFFICYAFMYIGNIIGSILNMIVSAVVKVEARNVLQEVLETGTIYQTIFIMVICAPIIEEIMFRKILIDRLHKYGDAVAIVVSALMFGLYHGNITQFVYATLIGLVLGYVYAKSGNIRYSIILHMIINFIGSVLSQLVMEKSGYLDIVEQLSENPEASVEIVMANAAGLLAGILWAFLLIAFAITGIVLFFVKKKHLDFQPGEITLEKGKRFSTIVVNYGAIAFIVLWLLMAVINMGIINLG
jgi:membrane protease YdiL (CAAX protease family)